MGTELYHHHQQHHVATNSSGSMSEDILPSVLLTGSWAVSRPPPSPAEQELIDSLDRLTHRLLSSDDSSLTHLEPWLGAYADLFLEHASVEQAYDRCIQAARQSTVVESVTLRCLPERELLYALEHLPLRTQMLKVEQSSRSQSLPSSAFSGLTPTLRSLQVDTRIVVRSVSDVQQLGQALSCATSLQEIELHVLPRCSFEDPHLSLDPLLLSLKNLRSFRLTAGYDHNHYHKPLCSKRTLAQFLHRNPQLETLQLDNIGLRDSHLCTLLEHVPRTLRHWQTSQHHPATTIPTATLQGLTELAPLESCILLAPREYSQRRDEDPDDALALYQDQLHVSCMLRRRRSEELIHALTQNDTMTERCRTMLVYAWVREDPLAAVWSLVTQEEHDEDDPMDMTG